MRFFLLLLTAPLLLLSSLAHAQEGEFRPADEAPSPAATPLSAEEAQRISAAARDAVVDGTFGVEDFRTRLGENEIGMDAESLPLVLQALRGLALQPGTEVAVYERLLRARRAAWEAFDQGEQDLPEGVDELLGELVAGGLLTETEAADLLAEARAAAASPSPDTYHVIARDEEGNWRTTEGTIILFSGEEAVLASLLGDSSERLQIVSSDELEAMAADGFDVTDRLATRRERANELILEAEKREELPTHGSLGQTITSWMFLGGHSEID